MATITFSPHPRGETVTIEVRDDVGKKLLTVAKDHKIPILFTCAASACGACLVEIEFPKGTNHAAAAVSEEEALLLHALGKLPAAQGGCTGTSGISATFRLACQYVVPDADILVRYPSDLGSL